MKTKLTENLESVIYKDIILPSDFISTQVTKSINRYDVINGPRHYELDFKNRLGIIMFIGSNGKSCVKFLKKYERGGWYVFEDKTKKIYSDLLKNLEKFMNLESNKLLYYVHSKND